MIEVEVETAAWTDDLPEAVAVVERAGSRALGETVGVVVILLSDDAQVRALNARFRGKDAPTNVLSFPAAAMPPGQSVASAGLPLGDVVLAHGVCRREAAAQGKTLADHLTHLTVHGVLHLLGRDHEDTAEADAMEAEERSILASLGVADPYSDHEHSDRDT